jgi:hypothetical protein
MSSDEGNNEDLVYEGTDGDEGEEGGNGVLVRKILFNLKHKIIPLRNNFLSVDLPNP